MQSPWPLAAAVALLAWRILSQPPSFLWRDWCVVFALYLASHAFDLRSAARTRAALYAMVYLLGIYVMGQSPWIWDSWRGPR